VEGLQALAKKYDRFPAQLAIAWVLRCSAVTAAIVGARHPTQIQETIAAGDWKLSDGDLTTIDRLSLEFEKIRK
jgi:aryl-alcohol dehydrogenase-like predicted oxidoreductase